MKDYKFIGLVENWNLYYSAKIEVMEGSGYFWIDTDTGMIREPYYDTAETAWKHRPDIDNSIVPLGSI